MAYDSPFILLSLLRKEWWEVVRLAIALLWLFSMLTRETQYADSNSKNCLLCLVVECSIEVWLQYSWLSVVRCSLWRKVLLSFWSLLNLSWKEAINLFVWVWVVVAISNCSIAVLDFDFSTLRESASVLYFDCSESIFIIGWFNLAFKFCCNR